MFTCLQTMPTKYYEQLVKVGTFVIIRVIFGVQFEGRKVDKKKRTSKMKHVKSILQSCGYFCQMSSRSIITILSYTISKLVHF